jgi:phosphatidylglycerophosphate synthase
MTTPFNWPLQYAMLLGVGTVLAVSLLGLAQPRLLRFLGTLPFLSPNWISIWRAPVVLFGQMVFIQANGSLKRVWIAFLLIVLGLVFDRIDGKMAKSLLDRLHFLPDLPPNPSQIISPLRRFCAFYIESEGGENSQPQSSPCRQVVLEDWISKLAKPFTRLPMFQLDYVTNCLHGKVYCLRLTGTGDWLDPLIDKISLLPFFTYLSFKAGLISPFVVIPMVLLDLFSTVIRKPFNQWPGLRRLQAFAREAKAGPFGKTKFIWQFFSLLIMAPALAGWLNPEEIYWNRLLASFSLGLGVLAGTLGILSRLTLMDCLVNLPWLRRAHHHFRKIFDH